MDLKEVLKGESEEADDGDDQEASTGVSSEGVAEGESAEGQKGENDGTEGIKGLTKSSGDELTNMATALLETWSSLKVITVRKEK